ncbi:hypothetical protein MCA0384 [Methylococcus capsulatus str. Bath]|uniref:Uncharacterized protein n=1 Tax=Methylococcus capsulatus (strain ATCC 33009 / NCIMB 11132 / Bath) TaxID=243233 RepID=Q60BT1_METCA|nr:hypothetical protein MCA0384 [Methylococcus capsulatus str. Bath]
MGESETIEIWLENFRHRRRESPSIRHSAHPVEAALAKRPIGPGRGKCLENSRAAAVFGAAQARREAAAGERPNPVIIPVLLPREGSSPHRGEFASRHVPGRRPFAP